MNAWFSLLAAGLASGGADTTTWAQHHPGVYTSSQEYSRNQPAFPGTVSPPAAAAKYVEVVQAHTYAVHRVPLAQVWGYATAHGQAFRLVERKAYTIQPQQHNLFTYSRQRAIQHSRSLHTVTEHFYSETLDGPLHPLTRRGLKQRATAR